MRTALPHVEARRPEHVVFLTTSGFMVAFAPQSVLAHHLDRPFDVRLLSSANGVFSVERAGDAAFVLRTDRTGWLSNMFARLARTDPVLAVGERVDEGLFVATITELTPDRDDVLAVRFDVDRPLADPSLLFLAWDGAAFAPLDVAALPPSVPHALADTSDVMAGMM